jgi:hypothetical protein
VWGQPKYAALFMTMATTGIREGKARVLQWQHVLPNGRLAIERAMKIDGSIGALKKRERVESRASWRFSNGLGARLHNGELLRRSRNVMTWCSSVTALTTF